MDDFNKIHTQYNEFQMTTLNQVKSLINAINPEKNTSVIVAKELIEKLKYLCKINPLITEMKPLIARGFANFILYFDSENINDAIPILTQLEILHNDNPENEEICTEFSHGILNIINITRPIQIVTSIKWLTYLQLLQKKNSSNQEIKDLYVQALYNLIIICGKKECIFAQQFLNQLIAFQNQHNEDQNIVILLSRGVVNIIAYSETHEIVENLDYISKLKELHQDYFYIEIMPVLLAQGYSNLIINSKFQNFDNAKSKLFELEKLTIDYPDFEEVNLEYIKSLGGFLYTFSEKLKGRTLANYIEEFIFSTGELVNRLEILSMTIMVLERILTENGQIALLPKYLLSSLSIHFTNKNCVDGHKYLEKMNYLYSRNTKNEGLALATILSNSIAFKALTLTNNFQLAQEAFSQIELIAGVYINHKEILTVFIDTKLN